ncbi:MAG: hypothetical protein IT287_06410 [Bdellovibrionaceae bacterium]|nr:hypothetical protein [Pseudobdellovibrionaceae bacterium]
MKLSSSNNSSLFTILLLIPMVLLFQNCGATPGGGDSSGGDGDDTNSASSSSRTRTSGYQPISGGGSGGSGGTFTFGNSSGGGSTTGGSGSGGSSSGGSSTGGSTSGSVSFDGKNCFSGKFGVLKEVLDRFGSGGGNSLAIIRMTPFTPVATIGGVVGVSLDFPDEDAGKLHSFNCTVSFDKLKKFFPAEYFTAQYTCAGNNNNITSFQCKDGHWVFAGSSCRCTRIPQDSGR